MGDQRAWERAVEYERWVRAVAASRRRRDGHYISSRAPPRQPDTTTARAQSVVRALSPQSARIVARAALQDDPSQSHGTLQRPQELSMIELLWTTCHTLTADEAQTLTKVGSACCPVCLDDVSEGDEILCVPCDAVHVGHWECLNKWLKQASSCPCCRFQLPDASQDPSRARGLIEHSLEAVKLLVLAAEEEREERRQTQKQAQEQTCDGTCKRLAVDSAHDHCSPKQEVAVRIAEALAALPPKAADSASNGQITPQRRPAWPTVALTTLLQRLRPLRLTKHAVGSAGSTTCPTPA